MANQNWFLPTYGELLEFEDKKICWQTKNFKIAKIVSTDCPYIGTGISVS